MKGLGHNIAITLSAIAFGSVLLAPAAAFAGDPDLVFRTIETEHFEIHYHQGLERVARMAAPICEEVHEELSIMFGWEIQETVQVVITDHTDSANGVAYSMHRPLIRIFATAPVIQSSIQNYDHWFRTVFTHEYTHLISLRIHSGLARVINAIFGDVYLPNTMSPTWYHEAITVFNETHRTTSGRIRSSNFKMSMRTAALEGTLLSLAEISHGTRDFPRGSNFYIYGAMFMEYLYTRFGEERIVELYHNYGSRPIPWGMNRSFKEVFGVDLVTLYDNWIESVKADARTTKEELSKQRLTESEAVTDDGQYKGRPLFDKDGGSVLIGVENGMQRTGIYRVELDGSGRELVAISGTRPELSMDRSGRLFYTRSAPYKTYYSFNDVFALDRLDSDPRRVTNGARAQGASISPGGDVLAIVTNDAGTTKLRLADERGNMLRTLVDSEYDDQVSVPAWSPDAGKIAAVIRRGAEVDLAIIDVASGELEFMTDDYALEDAPCFDPTGRYLIYASDRTGISNIYALDLVSGELFQVTNVLTGAYTPAVSPDGRTLAFVQYSSKGYDVRAMPFDRARFRSAQKLELKREAAKPLPAPSQAESKPYNPLPSLAPSYWMINATVNADWDFTLQVLTAATDAAGKHSIGAEVDYDISDTTFSGRLAYSYGGLGPGIHLGVSHKYDPRDSGYTVDGDSKRWIQKTTQGSFSLSFPIPGVDRGHNLSVGYSVIHAEPKEPLEVEPDPEQERPQIPMQYFRTGVSLDWSFNEVLSSSMGIAPHKGRQMGVGIDFFHPALGGDQTLATFRYGWVEYFAMPWLEYHTLAVKLSGGVNVSDPPEQAAFYMGGYGEQNIVDVIWNNSQAGAASLRGYPAGAFTGDQYHSLKLEYRMPIWFSELGYATLPVFLRRIQLGVFSDNAVITFNTVDRDDWRSSLGAEVVWLVVLGYGQTMVVRTGYSYGFMDRGGHEAILIIGGGF